MRRPVMLKADRTTPQTIAMTNYHIGLSGTTSECMALPVTGHFEPKALPYQDTSGVRINHAPAASATPAAPASV